MSDNKGDDRPAGSTPPPPPPPPPEDPALLDAPGKVVDGAVYYVEIEEHREKLPRYEMDNYRADPCNISYIDGGEPVDDFGYVHGSLNLSVTPET